ncbi:MULTISPECIES: hypothetical protein [unclassified Nostoc]|uniref:hypothetical protein n=1 Tax=unclassified Nostoc TaxID=2593658 RepID=UPI002AD53C87|nr:MULTISPECIES: hypothetical protein [unclassified Nostoc]MDZ8032418.1 hypothetical protein [Nostoc sp. DedSLP04]MDZ8127642.1 hypothetical protein [Nostoc sp. DedQUE07]
MTQTPFIEQAKGKIQRSRHNLGTEFLTGLGLTQNISQTLISLCSLRLCGWLFRNLCVSPMVF